MSQHVALIVSLAVGGAVLPGLGWVISKLLYDPPWKADVEAAMSTAEEAKRHAEEVEDEYRSMEQLLLGHDEASTDDGILYEMQAELEAIRREMQAQSRLDKERGNRLQDIVEQLDKIEGINVDVDDDAPDFYDVDSDDD